MGDVIERLQAELAEATAELKAHKASWAYAYAMAGGANGGREHPVHWETRRRTEQGAVPNTEVHKNRDI